jgi:hypothetical protein
MTFKKSLLLLIFLTFSCEKEEEMVPPTINTSEITDITQTSASCGGYDLSDNSTTITSKGVCWSTSINPTLDDEFTNEGTGDEDFTSLLIDLSPNVTYYVRAYATNAEGTAYGNEQSFTTLSTVYEGDLEFWHQQEVDDFGALGYTEINGSLQIHCRPAENFEDPIYNLSPIESIKRVNGDYRLDGSFLPDYEDFGIEYVGGNFIFTVHEGTSDDILNDLEYVGDNFIIHNCALDYLDGLSNMNYIGGNIEITDNWSLQNLDSFLFLNEVNGNLILVGNSNLNNIDGLYNIQSVHGSIQMSHSVGSNLNGLHNLTNVDGDLNIQYTNITDLNGLDNLTNVGGDLIFRWAYFTDLDGLYNLTNVDGDLIFNSNPYLTDLCGLETLLLNDGLAGDYTVTENGFNPSFQDILDGNCSQ